MGGIVEVPLAKLANAIKDVKAFLRAPKPTVRKATSVLGTLRGLMFAYPQIKLWTDALMNHVRSHQDRPWDAPAPLSSGTRIQLEEAVRCIQDWRGRSFVLPQKENRLYTDAAEEGWGATTTDGLDPVSGWFHESQVQEHINMKEARALLEAILVYDYRDAHIQSYTDGTTL